MKTIERQLTAAIAVAFAVLVGACSSDDGNPANPSNVAGSANNTGEAGEPSTGVGGSSAGALGKGGSGGTSGSSAATGGTGDEPGTGGHGSVANTTGGTTGSGATGGTGSVGSGSTGSGGTTGGTGESSGGTGGDSGTGGSVGGTSGGVGGSTGGTGGSTGGTGGSAGAGGSTGGSGGTTGGTGGSTGATGGTDGTGGTTGGTGGSSGGTGGDSGSGGTDGSGGTTGGTGGSGNTGSTGGTGNGGTGGTTGGTGGSSGGSGGTGGSTGGSAGTGGSSGSSGTGGSAGSGGPPPMTPFACDAPSQDFNWTGRIWDMSIFSEDEFVLAVGDSGDNPAYVHVNGSSRTPVTLPVPSGSRLFSVTGVWGESFSGVWVSGSTKAWDNNLDYWTGNPQGTLWFCAGTSCQTVGLGLTIQDNFVWSVSGSDANNAFALVNVKFGLLGNSEDTKVIRKNGNSWTTMSLPSHSLSRRLQRIEAFAEDDVFAVGMDLVSDFSDSTTKPVKGVLLYFNGTAWSEITGLPSDVVALWGVSEADGDVIVVGQALQSSVKKGVRCTSSDLVGWDCAYSAVTAVDSAVWTDRIGSAFTTGSVEDGGLQLPNSGRLAVRSEAVWGTESQGPHGPRVVRMIPGTNDVLIGSEDGVWATTCQ